MTILSPGFPSPPPSFFPLWSLFCLLLSDDSKDRNLWIKRVLSSRPWCRLEDHVIQLLKEAHCESYQSVFEEEEVCLSNLLGKSVEDLMREFGIKGGGIRGKTLERSQHSSINCAKRVCPPPTGFRTKRSRSRNNVSSVCVSLVFTYFDLLVSLFLFFLLNHRSCQSLFICLTRLSPLCFTRLSLWASFDSLSQKHPLGFFLKSFL